MGLLGTWNEVGSRETGGKEVQTVLSMSSDVNGNRNGPVSRGQCGDKGEFFFFFFFLKKKKKEILPWLV